ncbi:hypothetical protein PGRAN_11931 [Listeria grandensis FSL F6-0971]|uniref:Lipoprotein n=1 Tax=Listeria grandensis FSL F6-0971 TaxID=1265819 RepID=W7BA17_9LIST|nr:hypothetical protein [Listeria grandensis]EUJ22772.1 hypothetical protein PGRAN_11931 [Listeria grandensis FSL F6-0971]
MKLKRISLLVLMLVMSLVLAACGSSPQETFTKSVEKTAEPADQSTTTIGIKVDELPATLKADQSAAMLEGLSVKLTVSDDQKQQKSAATIAVKTAGLVSLNVNLDLLVDSKAEKVYFPLSDLYDEKGNLTTLLDQLTSGMFSKIKEENPDLVTKYVDLSTLSEELSGKEAKKSETDTKEVEKATKDLSKKVTKTVSDYFNSLPEDRFKEGDNGEITLNLTKADFTTLATKISELLDDKAIKADLKVIAESQGVSGEAFDKQYKSMAKSFDDAIQSVKDETNAKIDVTVTIQPDKNDNIESMKMEVKITDSKDKDKPETLGMTITMKTTDSAKLPKFPSSSDIISTEALQKIISESTASYYKSLYGDTNTDTTEIQ